MYYIEESDKPSFLEEKLSRVKLEIDRIILPIKKDNLNVNKARNLAKKTIKILKKGNSKKIVISKNIQNFKEYIDLLKQQDLEIIDGRWLYKILVPEILEYILNKENMKSEETNIYILINDLTEIALQTIKIPFASFW